MGSKKTVTEQPKRGRGRPASFPNAELVSIMTRVPADVRGQFKAIARQRKGGENLNQTFARVIGAAYARTAEGKANQGS